MDEGHEVDLALGDRGITRLPHGHQGDVVGIGHAGVFQRGLEGDHRHDADDETDGDDRHHLQQRKAAHSALQHVTLLPLRTL